MKLKQYQRKFIADMEYTNAYTEKEGKFQINTLTSHLKQLGKKRANYIQSNQREDKNKD